MSQGAKHAPMKRLILLTGLLAALSSPALAEVKTSTEGGFSVYQKAEVGATPDEVWKRLIAPKLWWSKTHSWSQSVEGFTLDARAGGCFCEAIQEKGADGKLKTVGTVEHMRVIYAHPGKVLRMQGALGPLQGEAVLGTLTVAMEANKDGTGTTLSFSYVVGGYMRQKSDAIAIGVDKVIGEQFAKLIEPLDPKGAAAIKGKMELDLDSLGKRDQDATATGSEDASAEAPADGAGEAPATETPPKPKPKTKLKVPETVKPVTPGDGDDDR